MVKSSLAHDILPLGYRMIIHEAVGLRVYRLWILHSSVMECMHSLPKFIPNFEQHVTPLCTRHI